MDAKMLLKMRVLEQKISTVLRKKYNTPDDKISFWKLDKTSTEYAEINNAIIKKKNKHNIN